MKQYFTATINCLQVTKFKTENHKIVDIDFENKVIVQNELFFTNFFGKFLRYNDNCPMLDEDEAYDYLKYQLQDNKKRPPLNALHIAYIDISTLTPTAKIKEQKKILKKTNNTRNS